MNYLDQTLQEFNDFVIDKFAPTPTHPGDAPSMPWWSHAVKKFIREKLTARDATLVKAIKELKDWEPHKGVLECSVRNSRNIALNDVLALLTNN